MKQYSSEKMEFPMILGERVSGENQYVPAKVRQVLGDFHFPSPPNDRPYLYGCMVLSLDGKMSFFDNPEGHLISACNTLDPDGGMTDFWIMNVCRAYADAVILGTGTLKARINKLWFAEISDPELCEARSSLGKSTEQPFNLIASVDGLDVPLEHPIFTLKTKPVILTSERGWYNIKEKNTLPVRLIDKASFDNLQFDTVGVIACGKDEVDTAMLLRFLRDCGLNMISVESPGYCWHLIEQEYLDEFFLNYSMVAVGGDLCLGKGHKFSTKNHPHSSLLYVGASRGFIYTRQKLEYK